MLSESGFEAREYVIEWHAELWRRYGVPESDCRRMLSYCLACLWADFEGEPRPQTSGDPHIDAMQAYLDRLFLRSPEDFPGRLSFA